MLRTTLAGLRLHKGRLVTTALAIALGVMFVSGTLVFTDTLRAGFSAQVMGSADRLDAVVLPEDGAEEGLAPDTLDRVRDLPEVAAAGGVIRGDSPLLDAEGRAVGQVPTAGLSADEVTRFTAAEGALPEAADEVALATTVAETAGFGVGDTVTVLDSEGAEREFTVSGLVDFGVDQEIAFRGAVVYTPETAAEVTGSDRYSEIGVVGAEGVPAERVAEAVGAAVDGGRAMTGAEFGAERAEQAGAQADVLATALLLFALISVFVAAIVIYNTFAILVAQRQREMALLRCVGALRGQVFRGVLLEAAVIGLMASAAGVLAGIGAGYAAAEFGGEALGSGSADLSLVVTPTAVAVGLAVGTGMAVLAALLPARRATRVPPLAALRTSAVAAGMEKGTGWIRAAAGAVLLAASAAITAFAVRGSVGEMALAVVSVAAMLAFLGVVVIGPLLVRGAVAVLGTVLRRTGVAGMLATDNARRSPKRAATAMIALTVGATLISGYSVVSATTEATMTDMLERQFPVDYGLMAQFGEDERGVPEEVAAALREDPAIATVMAERRDTARVAGADGPVPVVAYPGAEVGVDITSDVAAGDLADIGPGRIAVTEGYAQGRGVGDTLELETAEGARGYEIAAVVVDMQQLMGVTMDPADFADAYPDVRESSAVYVRGADDASPAQLRDAVYDAVAGHPTVQVQSMAEMRDQFDQILDTAFLTIAAMLGLAILIAVFGIANTMALSVLERTRESALLRALGLTGGQLRRMLALEAVLLCLTGALVGIGLGVVFGWAATEAALPSAIFTLPAARIAAFIAAAVLAGLLASALPARRAARTSISGTLASE
ncbi:ABC transporter permease [Nocardiopsis trehalosi]|uniref:ABC transporter permease n=1 Tax=Nocardiopsis trehalosi TaxID=109329 RepID=UPI0008335D8A|nr:FtsX-like permease family protein [Nocardiopsis trehalosi]